jgi:VWFA-related protein
LAERFAFNGLFSISNQNSTFSIFSELLTVMSRTFHILVIIACLGAVTPTGQSPQSAAQTPPTFRVEVNYVEVDARVTDPQGNFVGDLSENDFRVLEDGTPQAIKIFARVNLPVERQDAPLFKTEAIDPDVHSNRDEFNGRVFVLVLDDLQTDFRRSVRVRRGARQFIERYIGANDLAAIVYTGGAADRGQEFTSSRARLLESVEKFSGNKLPSELMSKLDDYYRAQQLGEQPRDTSLAERGHRARNSLVTLKNLAQYLANVRGRRKAVVWFGEGLDYDMDNPFTPDSALLRDTMKDAIDNATRAGVSFYGVDARGLGAGMDDAVDIGGIPVDDPNFNAPSVAIQNEVRRAQDSLRVMSEQTGGFAIVNRNDFDQGFRRIVEDNSSYYVLGYYPTNDKRDGRFRKVEVRVSRPGVKVQARNGYTAPKGKPAPATAKTDPKVPPDIVDALANPIPIAGVGLSVFAAPFTGPGSKASIALTVEFAPSTLRFVEQGGKFNEDIELHVLAIDAAGKMQDGGPTTIPLRLSGPSHDAVLASGFRVLRRLTVPPGRYQIRVAAKESNSGAVGTVTQPLDVPDFSKPPLALSGIAIASRFAIRTPTANPDPQLKDVLPGAPTASRDFPRGDTLALFTEVYDNQPVPSHRVSIASSILTDDGREMFAASDERSSDELQGKKGGYGYTRELPLGDLPAGRYVLRVTAKSLASNAAAVTREVEFRIR